MFVNQALVMFGSLKVEGQERRRQKTQDYFVAFLLQTHISQPNKFMRNQIKFD